MEKEHEAPEGIIRPRFSLTTKVLVWVVLPLFFVARALPSPVSAVLSSALLIPTFCLLRYDRARPTDQRVDLETFIWTIVQTGLVGSCAVALVQTALAWVFIFATLRGLTFEFIQQIAWGYLDMATFRAAVTAHMKSQHVLWTFMSLSHYLVTAISEASLSYFGLMYARRRGRILHEHNYLTLGVASALGYIALQSHFYLYSATQRDYQLIDLANNLVDYGWGIHILSGLLAGLGAARRDFRGEKLSILNILYLPVLFHCTWVLSMVVGGRSIYRFGRYMGLFPLVGNKVVQLFGICIISVVVQGSLAVVVRGRLTGWKAQQKKST
ncbi:hypothetical protein F4776DRAFT_615138 [Hypoxylon sp. NC0597]|nr:hypothetical protein F4776DRAFT_615138 [Hypoxylon sp. NC0597]